MIDGEVGRREEVGTTEIEEIFVIDRVGDQELPLRHVVEEGLVPPLANHDLGPVLHIDHLEDPLLLEDVGHLLQGKGTIFLHGETLRKMEIEDTNFDEVVVDLLSIRKKFVHQRQMPSSTGNLAKKTQCPQIVVTRVLIRLVGGIVFLLHFANTISFEFVE